MAENPQAKNDALEALDFVVNVLREHERELDRVVDKLAQEAKQIGNTSTFNIQVQKIEEKISGLQKQVTNIAGCLPTTLSQTAPAQTTQTESFPSPPTVILRCTQWEDFQALAAHAQTVAFSCNEDKKTFQADALKANQIVTYMGPLPKLSALIKTALAKQLSTTENNIIEGKLTTNKNSDP